MRSIALSAALLLMAGSSAAAEDWDPMADTWLATDALGRELPTHAEVGPPKDRTVAMFYFIWHGQHENVDTGPFDITKILAGEQDWGPMGSWHHWGEAEDGYYLPDDPWIIRKHARELTDAGVDVIVFDVTNAYTYPKIYHALLDVYAQIRKEGNPTPQIAFIAYNGDYAGAVQRIYEDLYAPGHHEDLWFRWDGKPLILTPTEGLSEEVRDFFSVRTSWAWSNAGWFGDGKGKWTWLDSHPQALGRGPEGAPEMTSVSVAQHPTTNIGRSHRDNIQPPPERQEPARGIYFDQQWARALELDPPLIWVTGYNEWVAIRFPAKEGQSLMGQPLEEGDGYFVDAYDQEYSRDIEPMKGGHTDNYYYQLVDRVRRYKGARPIPTADRRYPIVVDGAFADWDNIAPEYRDARHDAVRRDHRGWGKGRHYKNDTGRNDFEAAKAALGDEQIGFYVRCTGAIQGDPGARWMMVFVDTDRDSATGWEGFELVVNRVAPEEGRAVAEEWTSDGWQRKGAVPFAVSGQQMELALPSAWFDDPERFTFKWADNLQRDGAVEEFSISGDAAPNRRFKYAFELRADP